MRKGRREQRNERKFYFPWLGNKFLHGTLTAFKCYMYKIDALYFENKKEIFNRIFYRT